eukprot:sb/3475172/
MRVRARVKDAREKSAPSSRSGEGQAHVAANIFPLRQVHHEPIETNKQPIITRYLDHVTSYQPIRDQYFLIRQFFLPLLHFLFIYRPPSLSLLSLSLYLSPSVSPSVSLSLSLPSISLPLSIICLYISNY